MAFYWRYLGAMGDPAQRLNALVTSSSPSIYNYGFFRTVDTSIDEDGQLFKVVLITRNGGSSLEYGSELVFTDKPFTIEYSTSDDLFKPYKCSTATVGLLRQEFDLSFNATGGNSVLVTLLKFDNEPTEDDLTLIESDDEHFTLEWIGFATPNAYSQSFENYFDSFELECQDAFSTLQYYNYETFYTAPSFVSFSDIVKRWCVFLGTYKNIYVSSTIHVPTSDESDILHKCYISERNFFDEDNKPWKVLSVIEEICKYLQLSCVPYKDSLYFINYGAVKNSMNEYYHIQLVNGDFSLQASKVTLDHLHEILPEDFASTGTSISLLTTFNKFTVKDDFYPFDSIIPSLKDNYDVVDSYVLDQIGYQYEYTSEVIEATGEYTRINVQLGSKKHVVFIKYNGYENESADGKSIYTYWWNIVEGGVTANYIIPQDRIFNYQTTCTYVGALPIQYQVKEVEEFTDKINSISFKDAWMICCPVGTAQQIGGFHKVLEWRSDNISLGNDNYIVISGNFTFFTVSANLPHQMVDYDYYMDDDYSYQWASLRCGEYFWDGTAWIYQPARVVQFKLPVEYEYGKKAYGQSIPIANNIGYEMRLDGIQGYAVPIPWDDVEIKNIGFVLYNPNRIDDDSDNHFDPSNTVLSDFDIKIATRNRYEVIETNDSESEYTNIVDNGAVEEQDEVEMKITTWDFKSTNHSCVLYSERFYEDGYQNSARTSFKRLVTMSNAGTGDIAIPEELVLNTNKLQYSTPTMQLDVTLHDNLNFKPYSLLHYHFFDDKQFVVDGMGVDIAANANKLKLIEKK